MSETALARPVLAQYCTGIGLDLGFGGDRIAPNAITFDLHSKYTNVGGDPQILQGDCRSLPFICDGVLDFCYSSHLLEDLWREELIQTLREWRRILKTGGLLVTCCPDQPVYKAHCQRTGQPYNEAHKEQEFSLSFFMECAREAGNWEEVYSNPLVNTYSFHSVLRKA